MKALIGLSVSTVGTVGTASDRSHFHSIVIYTVLHRKWWKMSEQTHNSLLLVESQLVDKDMDDTEEGEILEDGEIADEDEPTADHKTTAATTTATDTHKMYSQLH